MTIAALQSLFKRDLEKLKNEVELYTSEENLWRIDKSITNSAGNLCLHIIGNLNAFIGAGLAKTSYIRQRDLEFSAKNIPRKTLINQLEETIATVETGLNNVTEEQLIGDFPIVIWDKPSNMAFILIHLATHLNYHLGQVNYHRRLLDS
ncbi:DUF1572 family protein [Muricauda sp. MAR_2010_75]|uniref:DUF1572 family protein n=1 Tax=Allomuricauda sp. MAR_2010_75 TaxID=1250232 RepID=UPI0005679347|nr:DUF1572 family protein [Muricauda sp. MAR_2010_75]